MFTVSIILLLIGSTIRGWGILNHRRSPFEASVIASGPTLAIFSIVSIILGLLGTIFIGSETSFWIGLIMFGAFLFLSGIWASILVSLGL